MCDHAGEPTELAPPTPAQQRSEMSARAASVELPQPVEDLLKDSAELRASRPGVCILWSLLLDVYPSEQAALAAVDRNSAIVLPYLNRPTFITGTWEVLNGFMSAEEALEVVTLNPGILACNPEGLKKSNAADIQRAAKAIDAVEQVPIAGRWAITGAAVLAVCGLIAAPIVSGWGQ